jgi:hypothetical protein
MEQGVAIENFRHHLIITIFRMVIKFFQSSILMVTTKFYSPYGVSKMGQGVTIENFQAPSYYHYFLEGD